MACEVSAVESHTANNLRPFERKPPKTEKFNITFLNFVNVYLHKDPRILVYKNYSKMCVNLH